MKRWLNLEHDRDNVQAEAQELANAIENQQDVSSFSHSFSIDCDSSMSFLDTYDALIPICESTMMHDDSHSILTQDHVLIDPTQHSAIQRVMELSCMIFATARESGNQDLINIATESISSLQRELENRFSVRPPEN